MRAESTIDSAELRELIADVLDIEPDLVTDDANFTRDLGVDSLLALELAVTLERHYQIKVESHEVADVQTLADVRTLLSRKVSSPA